MSQVAPTTPDPKVGTPIGLMTIPKIGMRGAAIVEGTDEHQLQQGPGHYLGTPLPGQAGNAAIAGHRTTYGAPFYDLNVLQPGDPITITNSTKAGKWDDGWTEWFLTWPQYVKGSALGKAVKAGPDGSSFVDPSSVPAASTSPLEGPSPSNYAAD